MQIRERVKFAAKQNIEKAQYRQEKNYDKKHKSAIFEIGEKVLLRNSRENSRKGGKLKNRLTPLFINA